MKKALITGITGQDGSYLAELLLEKGYEVHGIIRRSSSFNTGRIMHIFEDVHNPDPKLKLHYGDLTDGSRISKLIEEIEPTEVYNLGAQSHVRISFDEPVYTAQTVGMGALRMLEAIRMRFYNIKVKPLSDDFIFAVGWVRHDMKMRGPMKAWGGDARISALFRKKEDGWKFIAYTESHKTPVIYTSRGEISFSSKIELCEDLVFSNKIAA